MGGFIFIALLIGIGVAIATVSLQRQRATGEVWRRAASTLGLHYDPGSAFRRARLDGTMARFPVQLDTYTQSQGNSSQVYTRYRVGYPPLGLGLTLTRQTAMSRIGRFFGAQDVTVGDRTFDDAFVVKTSSPEGVRAFLTPARRAVLYRLLGSFPSAKITDAGIELGVKGYERNHDRLVSITRRLVSVARTLTEPTAPLDEAVKARAAGDLGQAAEAMRAAVKPHPDDAEPALLEAETLYAAGRADEAAERVEELARSLPADPDVEGLRDRIRAAPRPAPAAAAATPSAEEVATALFGDNLLSFETDARFDESYRGAAVRWSGPVKRITRFERDFDFGEGPGTKAVVTVATIENDLYGQTEVDAVVRLPANASDRLERGETVTFEGRLVKVDGLMRNLFVEDGRLV